MNNTQGMHEFVKDYISQNCIYKGEFDGKAPNSKYDWIIDIRSALLNPDVSFAVANLMLERMANIDRQFSFQVCTRENTPLGTALSLSARYFGIPLNVILCRKERRAYGLYNRFEGRPNHFMAMMVDEMSNHGRGLLQCFEALQEEDIPVSSIAFSVINKSNSEDPADRYLPNGIAVLSLFNLDDFGLIIGKKKD